MSIVKGSFADIGGAITTDTPAYEWDNTSTADVIYIRYENTTSSQYIERIASNKHQVVYGLWANRTTLAGWRAINYGG